MELQQSPLYAKYIAALKWDVLNVDGVVMFYKRIPLMGGLLKIQRPPHLPNILPLIKEYRIKTVAIEPTATQDIQKYKRWVESVSAHCQVVRSSYMPTKTILIPLAPDNDELFNKFSEAKRRAVRKAQKNGVTVQESKDIKELMRIKNKSGGFLGFITTIGIDKFWHIMAPKHPTILLAYHNSSIVGGVLLVFWNKTAFYWIAGATQKGKKLFAPTILVFEALKVAKKHGATQFDFVGVWDERMPKANLSWKGFTKFKEGFGGKSFYYPVIPQNSLYSQSRHS